MRFKHKKLVWVVVVPLVVAVSLTAIKMYMEERKEKVLPVVNAIFDSLVGAYQWVAGDVALPIWLVVLVPLLLLIGIALLGRHTIKLASALKVATAKPDMLVLTDEAHKVLRAIVESESNPYGFGMNDLPMATGLSEFLCKGATEDLQGLKFINANVGRWGSSVTLTPAGRSYIRAPGSPLASLVK